jgi:hypothetical protein
VVLLAIIQLGIDELDNTAYVQTTSGKWVNVPMWVYCEWVDPGAIMKIVRRYKIDQLAPLYAHEYEAFWNLEQDARAIRRYIEKDSNYLDALEFSPLMQQLVDLEIYLMQRHGWMKRDDVLDRIVETMEERGIYLSNRQIAGYLSEADDIMRAAIRELEGKSIRRVIKTLEKQAA